MASPSSADSDAVLLGAAADGDADAFARFYRRHLPGVLRFLLRDTGDRETAGDLAGEVFAAALLGAARYRPEHDSALPWLCGIARYKASESRRRGRAEDRARRRLEIPRETLEADDLERVAELADLDPRVLDMLDELPPAQREAIWARIVEERGYGEIAAAAGTSEAAVRQRVSRALAWLRTRAGGEFA
jgi:RNA polymerase sigma-70 factor (ECF subfamily)